MFELFTAHNVRTKVWDYFHHWANPRLRPLKKHFFIAFLLDFFSWAHVTLYVLRLELTLYDWFMRVWDSFLMWKKPKLVMFWTDIAELFGLAHQLSCQVASSKPFTSPSHLRKTFFSFYHNPDYIRQTNCRHCLTTSRKLQLIKIVCQI